MFHYFGLDPEVNQSGKFTTTQMHITKHDSRFARRAIFAVALGAIMHKVCNIIFAILRNEKAFELRSPEKHCTQYQRVTQKTA
ncbi:transposase [Cellulosilyticum ruminicola]|uniref:transposase n=1 Tax=Cellulosilyticum ruminicola TaxID=425254 RepID=UPI0006D13098